MTKAMTPSLAIIMRTKDRPVLLGRALESVFSQTSDDWHLYLVNDVGDIDPVRNALSGYDESRVTLIDRQSSKGMESATNAGLNAMQGEPYFAIHDDDDTWHPTFVEKMLAKTQERPDAIGVSCGCAFIEERMEDPKKLPVFVKEHQAFTIKPLTIDVILFSNPLPPIALIYRSSLIDRIGFFNEDMDVVGDWEFMLRAIHEGDIAFCPHWLARYCVRDTAGPDGNSIRVSKDRHRERLSELLVSMERKCLDNPEMTGLLVALSRVIHTGFGSVYKAMQVNAENSEKIIKQNEVILQQNREILSLFRQNTPKAPQDRLTAVLEPHFPRPRS